MMKHGCRQESLADRLKVNEYRALNLFRGIDLDHCVLGESDVDVTPRPEVTRPPRLADELFREEEENLSSDLELSD
jgi:hypothetical protein